MVEGERWTTRRWVECMGPERCRLRALRLSVLVLSGSESHMSQGWDVDWSRLWPLVLVLMRFGDNDCWLCVGDIDIRTLHDLGDTYIHLCFCHAHIIVAKILVPSNKTLLFIPTGLCPLNLLAVLLLKCAHRYLIQSQQRLIWILYQDVFAILHIPAHIYDGPNDAPTIGEVEIHLFGEFARVITHDAEDDMPVGDFGRSSGYEPVIKGLAGCMGDVGGKKHTQVSSRLRQPI